MLETRSLLLNSDFPQLKRAKLETLQLNLGYRCNLSCTHCHVNAGPTRKEQMTDETLAVVLDFIDHHDIQTLDLTGGAPEMHPGFKALVREARRRNVHVMDRCNLTILLEPGFEDMAEFLAEQGVEIVASLPCYTQDNVDKQRGKGVFDGSIEALRRLNEIGYGKGDATLPLSLVYNPGGPFLPPPQEKLEEDYKRELASHFDIHFDHLYTITNMPISRFGSVLLSKGQFHEYMDLLKNSYSAANLEQVMCRTLVSVDWQGYVYDCDFNQMLNMPMARMASDGAVIASDATRVHLSELLDDSLEGRAICVADHCYGCTAGQGSSCGGALE
ncbi:MAG: arsenosugar biosynthesis radical SAM protein ArsS [Oleiphilaceae bacterium]|nr:arsenosugar biosynthesis radical SAM protein ArsS [Oleiphilaceae bacterium]